MCMERCPLSFVSTNEELLVRNSSGSGIEKQNMAVEFHRSDHATPLSANVGTSFVDKRRSFSRYSSLAGLKVESVNKIALMSHIKYIVSLQIPL
jgi:hypothetical protein